MTIDVLMVIEGDIATTHLIERILLACGPYGVGYRKKLLPELKVQDIRPGTIPLFVRCCAPLVEQWVDLLHRARHPYLYYIDDNFWHIRGDSALARHYQHPIVRRALAIVVRKASKVLTNSPELALFVGRFNKNVEVLPAFFDFSLIDGCDRQPTKELRIGFAGSASRADDLDIISPIICPVLKAFPQAVFEFAGVMPHGVEPNDRIRFFPHMNNYAGFVKFQAERGWSIGLAPLCDNESNRCKTNNKYREYGACKIAAIYSDMPPYKRSVVGGVTGILVDNSTESWLSAVFRLASNPAECTKLGERAYQDVRDKHSVERVAGVWAECIQAIVHHVKSSRPIPLETLGKYIAFKRMRLKIDTVWMQITSAHREGGALLVVSKSIRQVVRLAARRDKQAP